MALDKLSGNSFATGAIANSLGYTPANKAGDTFTGTLIVNNSIYSSNSSKSYMNETTSGVYARSLSANGVSITLSVPTETAANTSGSGIYSLMNMQGTFPLGDNPTPYNFGYIKTDATTQDWSYARVRIGTYNSGTPRDELTIYGGKVGVNTSTPSTLLTIKADKQANGTGPGAADVLLTTATTDPGVNGAEYPGAITFQGYGWNYNGANNQTAGTRPLGIKIEPQMFYWGANSTMSSYGQTNPFLRISIKHSYTPNYEPVHIFDGFGRQWTNKGYGSLALEYGVRAWAQFDGAGTIRASGGVSSVTKNSTGNYALNFANTMPDSYYAAVATADVGGWTTGATQTGAFGTGSVGINVRNTSMTTVDGVVSIAVVR